jgi:hypothetical protein
VIGYTVDVGFAQVFPSLRECHGGHSQEQNARQD